MRKRPVRGPAASDEGGQYADGRHEPETVEGVHDEAGDDVAPETSTGSDESDEDAGDTARLPQIAHAREGVTVVEQALGHAVGQWIFQVRCDCGRRWFDLKAVDNVQCPRCGRWVHVEVDPGE
jgi:hypothetical protein